MKPRIKSRIGHVIGHVKLTEKFSGQPDPTWSSSWDRREKWWGICSCGARFIFVPSLLRVSTHKSCGCKTKKLEKISDGFSKAQKASVRGLYNRTKNHAKHSKKIWDIDMASFEKLVFSLCHYCRREPNKLFNVYINTKGVNRQANRREWSELAYITIQGLDRVDSKKGYTLDNVVTCCMTCNFAKHIKPYDEFITWLKDIAKVWKDVN